MHLAAEFGMIKMIKLLVENHAEVDAVDWHNFTPLHYAAKKGYGKVSQALLENQATVNVLEKVVRGLLLLGREFPLITLMHGRKQSREKGEFPPHKNE